jgi:hypothetical protein
MVFQMICANYQSLLLYGPQFNGYDLAKRQKEQQKDALECHDFSQTKPIQSRNKVRVRGGNIPGKIPSTSLVPSPSSPSSDVCASEAGHIQDESLLALPEDVNANANHIPVIQYKYPSYPDAKPTTRQAEPSSCLDVLSSKKQSTLDKFRFFNASTSGVTSASSPTQLPSNANRKQKTAEKGSSISKKMQSSLIPSSMLAVRLFWLDRLFFGALSAYLRRESLKPGVLVVRAF